MLNYGFSKCSLYIDKKMEALPEIPVRNGKKKKVSWFMKNSSTIWIPQDRISGM